MVVCPHLPYGVHARRAAWSSSWAGRIFLIPIYGVILRIVWRVVGFVVSYFGYQLFTAETWFWFALPSLLNFLFTPSSASAYSESRQAPAASHA